MEPRLYTEFAQWWPLLSCPSDYEEEAEIYYGLLAGACDETPRTLLELGCGGGNNASFLAPRFESVTLTDLSPGMLDVSRALNPTCEHIVGDMRHLRLGRVFDCVFIHDAIVYMATEEDLRAAMDTAFEHCRPGGAALLVPDHVRETFRSTTGHGGHDGPERSMRYLQWEFDPDPDDCVYSVDFAYLLREADGRVQTECDHHTAGLFGREQWLDWLQDVGFDPECVPIDHSELEPGSFEGFLCRRECR